MAIDKKNRAERLKYDVNREAAKVSALLWGKIGKYEYLMGEKILPSDPSKIVHEAKFTYWPLGKAFANETKTIKVYGDQQIEANEKQGRKQLDALNNINLHNNKKDNSLLLKQKKLMIIKMKDLMEQTNRIIKIILMISIMCIKRLTILLNLILLANH